MICAREQSGRRRPTPGPQTSTAAGPPDQTAAYERVRAWQEIAAHPAAAAAPASFRRYAAARLTEALTARLDTEQGIETLQELATAMRAGLDALPPDSPMRYYELAELGGVLWMSYEQSADSPTLDEAITVLAEALELMPHARSALPAKPARRICTETATAPHDGR